MSCKLVIDTPNMIFRVAAMNQKNAYGTDEEIAALALHSCFITMLKYYNKFKPERIFLTFEGRKNWRKVYTASDDALTPIGYKANRIVDKTKEDFFKVIHTFREIVEESTSCVILQDDNCESDDFIGGMAQSYATEESPVIIISSDKDFIQLLQHDHVKLLDPLSDSYRTCDDVNYFIFEKCIRGDRGDNVMSAYPRVRSKRLQEAFVDPYQMTNLMNEEWTHPLNNRVYRVGDVFEENRKLMILDAQPDNIKELVRTSIPEKIKNAGKYNHFSFAKHLGKNGLQNMLQNINNFVPMLQLNTEILPEDSTFQY